MIKTSGPTVKITPMPRPEIKVMFAESAKARKEGEGIGTTKDQDGEIIKKHLIEPKVPDEEIPFLKNKYSSAIMTAILAISLETNQDEIDKAGKLAVQKYANKLEGDIEKNRA